MARRIFKLKKLNTFNVKRETVKNLKYPPAGLRVEAEAILEKAKSQLLSEFNAHPVTMELEMGPDGQNITNTLGGRGNLFSFIGFYDDESPTGVVRSFFEDIRLRRSKPLARRAGASRARFIYTVEGYTKEELFDATAKQTPWLGKSWLKGIESGISGLGQYLYWRGNDKSRSGEANQASRKLRSGAYRPTKYISELLSRFYKNLRV